MRRYFVVLMWICAIITGVGCSREPTEATLMIAEAQALLERASTLEDGSKPGALALQRAALAKIDSVAEAYPASREAGEIKTGTLNLGAETLSDLRIRIWKAERRENAHADLLSCARFVAGQGSDFAMVTGGLVSMASYYASSGDTAKALILLEDVRIFVPRMANTSAKVGTMRRMAGVYRDLGRRERALEILLRAAREAENPYYTMNRVFDLIALASSFSQLGRDEEARGLLAGAVGVAEKEQDRIARKVWLATVANAYADIGAYDRAVSIARRIGAESAAFETIAQTASRCARAGDSTKAGALLQEALRDAARLDIPADRADALAAVAAGFAEIGRHKDALNVLDDAKAITMGLAPRILRDWVQTDIIDAYAAMALCDSCLRIAKEIEYPAHRVDALTSSALCCIKAGRTDKALEELAEAVGLVAGLESGSRDHRIQAIAKLYIKSDRTASAIDLVDMIDEDIDRYELVEMISSAYARKGRTEEALGILTKLRNADLRSSALAGLVSQSLHDGNNDLTLRALKGLEASTQAARALARLDIACSAGRVPDPSTTETVVENMIRRFDR